MLNLSTPLLRKTFQSADKMADAMVARCYNDDRTDPEFFTSAYDNFSLGVCILVLAVSFLS
jgi:energy-coupling factor transporter transmembrane protein EcfT